MSGTTKTQHVKNLTPTDDLSTYLFGYNITIGPPKITGVEEFSASPTTSVIMGTNKPIIETQTVDTVHYYSKNLKETSGTKTFGPGDLNSWDPSSTNDQITFTLNLPGPAPTILEIAYLFIPFSGTAATLYVNGQQVWPGPNNPSYTKAFIDASFLKAGDNELILATKQLVKSVTVSSIEVQAEYFWTSLLTGSIRQGGTFSKEIDITLGNSDTDSETNQFSETLGGSGSLKGIGLSLSAALSTSETHSVTISEQVTKKQTVTQSCPDNAKSVTFQMWQLCVKFTAGDKTLTLRPPSEIGGEIISRTYEET
ncbi:MAG: hypothetical protein KTR23_08170 [Rhodospirillales bacterium]|nr:hypothetical protein [Rhodospirillales bacterium]